MLREYERLKEALLQRKGELEQHLHEQQEHHHSESASTGELSQYDNHPADSATELYEREKDFALEGQARNEYQEVTAALQRLDDGSYGICEQTGERIPLERLEANPTARTTVSASTEHLEEYLPVEEEVLGSFGRYSFDDDDTETEFDAEDSYQAVARFNENSMVYEGASLDEDDEQIGFVEKIEGFASTGIEGYTGDENVEIQRNVHYDDYIDGK